MSEPDLGQLCEHGQELLMAMQYLRAEAALARAERIAWSNRDFDTLARLYMPLQESRRQRRQRCGEGVVRLDLISEGAHDHVRGQRVLENYSHGQLLVGGWGTIEPAMELRRLAEQHEMYVETFLAAVYPMGDKRAVAIIPLAGVALPVVEPMSIDRLIQKLPPHSIVMHESELPAGDAKGSTETYARVMSMWEKLAAPFFAAAETTANPIQRIEAYRKTIAVDYACELAHQKISEIARELTRRRK